MPAVVILRVLIGNDINHETVPGPNTAPTLGTSAASSSSWSDPYRIPLWFLEAVDRVSGLVCRREFGQRRSLYTIVSAARGREFEEDGSTDFAGHTRAVT